MKCNFCGEECDDKIRLRHGLACCKCCEISSPETLQLQLLVQIRNGLARFKVTELPRTDIDK